MKYHVISLFDKSNEVDIMLIPNGYYNTSSKCTHYAAIELIRPQQEKVPGKLTAYDDLVPINVTNQEVHKSAILYA